MSPIGRPPACGLTVGLRRARTLPDALVCRTRVSGGIFRLTRRRAEPRRLGASWVLLCRRRSGTLSRPCRHGALSGGRGCLLNYPHCNVRRFGGHRVRLGSWPAGGCSCSARMSRTDANISCASAALSSAWCSRECRAAPPNSVRYAYGFPGAGNRTCPASVRAGCGGCAPRAHGTGARCCHLQSERSQHCLV